MTTDYKVRTEGSVKGEVRPPPAPPTDVEGDGPCYDPVRKNRCEEVSMHLLQRPQCKEGPPPSCSGRVGRTWQEGRRVRKKCGATEEGRKDGEVEGR